MVELNKTLRNIEDAVGFKILLASEIGSRMKGLDSPKSDYDIKFISAKRSDFYNYYLRGSNDHFPLQKVGNYDIQGFDYLRAVELLSEFNPTIIDVLRSPLFHYGDHNFANSLLGFVMHNFNKDRVAYGYYKFAFSNYKQMISSDDKKSKNKLYLHIFDNLLTCEYALKYDILPSHDFIGAVNCFLRNGLNEELKRLVEAKKSGNLPEGSRNEVFDGYLRLRIPQLESYFKKDSVQNELSKFLSVLDIKEIFEKEINLLYN